MTSFFIICGISIILNVIFVIGIINLIRQNEEYEDMIVNTRLEIMYKVENALQQMRDIDTREVFEKDDEVGSTFQQLKNIIQDLNNEI